MTGPFIFVDFDSFEISKNDNLINFWILILKNKDEL
jgi:hypothetical protein